MRKIWTPGGNLITAINVAALHASAMILAGGAVAFAVYEWLGLKFIARSWFNLETLWPLSLILVGGIDLASMTISEDHGLTLSRWAHLSP